MLVVLDSNIFISALISDHGAPHAIFKAWRSNRFQVATCPEQLVEIRRASHYTKLRSLVQAHIFGSLLNHLQRATIVDRFPVQHHAKDPHDSYLLNLTVAAKAHYLVTGDKRAGLLARRRIGQAKILTAFSFQKAVLDE